MRTVSRLLLCSFVLFALTLPALWSQTDWPTYGHDLASTRYSTLKQIDTTNVAKLVPAWTYHMNTGGAPRRGKLEATPLVVNDVMYLPTSDGAVVALDPEKGKELWRYDLPGTL